MKQQEYAVAGRADLPLVRRLIRQRIRSADAPDEILIRVAAGAYEPGDLDFCEEDCSPRTHIVWQGEVGATIDGALRIPAERWSIPSDAILDRLTPETRPHVRAVSLTDLGLTAKDWGEEVTIGGFCMSEYYDGAPKGTNCELSCEGRRMTKARYPNEGYLKLDGVLDEGDHNDLTPDRRNPRGGIYLVDADTAARMKRWKNPEGAWLYGYLFFDWADSSTPIRIDPEQRRLLPRYVSQYGAAAGQPYYLYNVLEELDSEGEWYLDRRDGTLLFWPMEGAKSVELAYAGRPLISLQGVSNLELRGFALTCSEAGAIRATGHDLTLSDLTVSHIGTTAIRVEGERCSVRGCTLFELADDGIVMFGGDRKSLIHAENTVTDNIIHDFATVSRTYRPAISLNGVGHTAAHNLICNAPHAAIMYSGNEHLIEYNDIHDVVLDSSDAGAVYSGRDVVAHGTVIRYNRLRRIGANGFTPVGIYWDDCLSGQTAYGNLLIDVGGWGFQVGGGRENRVEHNLIVRSGGAGIEFDDRMREGYLSGGWFGRGEGFLADYEDRKPQKEPWVSRYPLTRHIRHDDDCDRDDPCFYVNPSFGAIRENITLSPGAPEHLIAEAAYRFSHVESNPILQDAEAAGWDEQTGYLLPACPALRALPDFPPIPIDKIGPRGKAEK